LIMCHGRTEKARKETSSGMREKKTTTDSACTEGRKRGRKASVNVSSACYTTLYTYVLI
jgi:hypothetical protein